MQHAIIAQHNSVMLLLTVPFVQMCEVLEAKTTTSVGEFSILSNFEVHHSIGDIGVDAMRQLSSLFNHYLNSRFEKKLKRVAASLNRSTQLQLGRMGKPNSHQTLKNIP